MAITRLVSPGRGPNVKRLSACIARFCSGICELEVSLPFLARALCAHSADAATANASARASCWNLERMGEGLDRTTRSLELLNNQQLLTQTWAKVVSVAVTQGAIWGKRCATHIETLVGKTWITLRGAEGAAHNVAFRASPNRCPNTNREFSAASLITLSANCRTTHECLTLWALT